MATNPKMAERIKREAPRCKYIKNVETGEIFRNTGNTADRWIVVYEHAIKNPETFERVFHIPKEDGSGATQPDMETPASLLKKSMPVLRQMANDKRIKKWEDMDKRQLIDSILGAQESDLAALESAE